MSIKTVTFHGPCLACGANPLVTSEPNSEGISPCTECNARYRVLHSVTDPETGNPRFVVRPPVLLDPLTQTPSSPS